MPDSTRSEWWEFHNSYVDLFDLDKSYLLYKELLQRTPVISDLSCITLDAFIERVDLYLTRKEKRIKDVQDQLMSTKITSDERLARTRIQNRPKKKNIGIQLSMNNLFD
jgi:hypothetical protein